MDDVTVDIEKIVKEECARRKIPENLVEDVHAITLRSVQVALDRLTADGDYPIEEGT